MSNNSILLSDRVGVSLSETIANWELLKKSLEVREKSLQDEKASLVADRQQLEAEKTQVRVTQAQLKSAQSQLEDAKSQLERAQTQLSDVRVQLETARTHLEAANDKTRLDAAKASLEAAKLKFEAATNQLNAAKTRFESAKIQLDAATTSIAAEKSGLEDDKAKLQIKVSQLESDKSKLETRVYQLENDKSKLEADKKQSKTEIQSLNDKVKELQKQPKGKNNHMIAARQLEIAFHNDSRYWLWKTLPDSMYGEVAENLGSTWFSVHGRLLISELFRNRTYAAYFVFKLTDNHKLFDNLGSEAVLTVGQAKSTKNVSLVGQGQDHHPMQRQDGWMEVELGQCYVREDDGQMDILIKSTDVGNLKTGLVVRGFEVRPAM